jgi:hypothetical protein
VGININGKKHDVQEQTRHRYSRDLVPMVMEKGHKLAEGHGGELHIIIDDQADKGGDEPKQ